MDKPRPVDSRFGISPDDPAFDHITLVLAQLKVLYGFDTTDPAIQQQAIKRGREGYAAAVQRARFAEPEKPTPAIVYYLRVGKLVKIGTTRNLDHRIRAYPPDAVLLATEPGDRKVELRRHRQFKEWLAARSEWFHPSAALIGHINSLREQPLTAADLAA